MDHLPPSLNMGCGQKSHGLGRRSKRATHYREAWGNPFVRLVGHQGAFGGHPACARVLALSPGKTSLPSPVNSTEVFNEPSVLNCQYS